MSWRDQELQRWTSATPAGPARRLSAEEAGKLGYVPPTQRYVRRSYSGGSIPLPADHPWGTTSEKERAEREASRARAERRASFAASEVRLGKEIRAYATLDRINAEWERRGRR